MNELPTKVSSYNLFNYLLPGVIFAVLAGDIIRYPILHRDLISAGFLCYFLGLVISRFGSLVVEPILKRLSFIKFADYGDFVAASKEDQQLAVLSEANNTYRTLSSLFILLLLLRVYAKVEGRLPFIRGWSAVILAV